MKTPRAARLNNLNLATHHNACSFQVVHKNRPLRCKTALCILRGKVVIAFSFQVARNVAAGVEQGMMDLCPFCSDF